MLINDQNSIQTDTGFGHRKEIKEKDTNNHDNKNSK